MTLAEVRLWNQVVGAVALAEGSEVAEFEFDPQFRRDGMELAPLTMPLSGLVHRFPALRRESFHGLPGLLADSLPGPLRQCADRLLAGRTRSNA